MFYQRKRFEERKSIESIKENTEEKNGEKVTKIKENINSKQEEKKIEERKKICPRCGRYLDENHKTNLIGEDEFFHLKEEMEKVSYGKLLNGDEKSNKIGEEIKRKVKKEFHLEDEISGYKQGHHLISRTDVFFNNKDSAIIALSAGYDVNCIENGIVLPTDLKKYKSDWDMEDKFRVMSSTKRQLHSGHHNFNLDLDSKVEGISKDELKKIPKQNYSTLASKEFRKSLKKFDEKCFLTEEEKKEIKSILNRLSEKMREDVEKFKDDPKSCNLYVSKAALQYAFLLKEKRYRFINLNSFTSDNIVGEKYEIVLDYNLNSITLQQIGKYEDRYDIKYLKFCADIMMFLYKDKLYFLKDNLNINQVQPVDDRDYKEVLKKDKNKSFEFIKEIEKYLEGREINIRELMRMRKKNII